ncbi:type II toxin-antitoxin system Phd/YefM family antitoxin [Ornithinimicrobium cryptoxanthini]|uniref:type II toxin-antitoxin system Phd/YefM family antitoxin n=1 Tax=Ornithinimicrobium cryptoxanthini TaxID=2934161 RepID=UPI0021173C83|nr:type II toxin-antitoxin system Phd/YefM family antitoxin [Ornithinimicrobium cryptoxanthini]
MTATKVGIREFRAGLADFVDSDAPVAVTRHGQTVGYFIPVKQDRAADAVALRAAGEKLDALLELTEGEVEEMVTDFKRLRRAKR